METRATLKQLGALATNEIGFCTAIHWRTVQRRHVPDGMISPTYRLASVIFSGYAPAYRFYELLVQREIAHLPRQHVRLVRIPHAHGQIVGVAVVAILSPNADQAEGLCRAPAYESQPGYQRFFRRPATQTAWWDDDECRDDEAVRWESEPTPAFGERWQDDALEADLNRLEAEYNHSLAARSRTLCDVHALVHYARREPFDPSVLGSEQVNARVSVIEQRYRQRQALLDRDAAEVADALNAGQ